MVQRQTFLFNHDLPYLHLSYLACFIIAYGGGGGGGGVGCLAIDKKDIYSTVLCSFFWQDWSTNGTARDDFEQTIALGYYGIVC